MILEKLRGKKLLVLGYGINNRHLCAYLLEHGFTLTIRDKNKELPAQFAQDHPDWSKKVEWQIMGDITEKLEGFDVIFRTPGLPYSSPALQKALARGQDISSQTKLFFDLCPASVIGVTGTKGKGTTCSLLYAMLQEGYSKGRVYLGGNIGVDPFSFLDALKEQDLVVLELSSFQLQDLHKSPHVAVILHVTADHLEHHRSLEEYHAAKARLLLHQGEDDVAVVNVEYPEMARFAKAAKGLRYGYSRHTPARQSAWAERLEGKEVVFYQMDTDIESFEITNRRLLGEHNLENILPAVLVAAHYKVSSKIMQKVVKEFPGLEHRLAFLGQAGKVDFYDDSIATTPESCQVAMEAFPGRRIHLIAGGKDKGRRFDELAPEIVRRCATVSLLPGSVTKHLQKSLELALKQHPAAECRILDKAKEPVMETVLSGIHPHLKPGDVVLLAPAASSDTPFANYKERGDAFKAALYKRYGN